MCIKRYEKEISLSINIIEENLRIDYPIKNIIEKVNIEKSQFAEIFKFYSGYTISQYRRKRVLSEASKQIIKGKKLIDVAFEFGYESSRAFSRAFKREFNISPNNLKKECIEIKLLPKLSEKIINEKSELIEDISFSGSKVFIRQVKESLESLTDKDFIKEYSIDNTTHTYKLRLNNERILNYLEEFDEIMLPSCVYNQMIKFHDYTEEDLETVLAMIYIAMSEQYQEDLLLNGQITASFEEINYAINVINTFYDIKNPRLDGLNYYFGLNKQAKEIIETLKICK